MGAVCSSRREGRKRKVSEEPSFAHLIFAADASGFSPGRDRKVGGGFSLSAELICMSPGRAVASKVHEVGSIWGKAGAIGLEKAVEVLDTLGSTVSHLNPGIGFSPSMNHRGNKISILAFEVANTISRAEDLMQSLSEENVQLLKSEILHSVGVQNLVSSDPQELMRISAADKREELDLFCREVIRFGNLCKNPQLHNLDRYFQKLESDTMPRPEPKEMADVAMQQLSTLANSTVELYHELNVLDRLEKDYQRKIKEDGSPIHGRREEHFMPLHDELKRQRKLVETLKKKTPWSKNLDEI
ncbi:protein PSK SIMULATOR 2-like [Wolffia australiana]